MSCENFTIISAASIRPGQTVSFTGSYSDAENVEDVELISSSLVAVTLSSGRVEEADIMFGVYLYHE